MSRIWRNTVIVCMIVTVLCSMICLADAQEKKQTLTVKQAVSKKIKISKADTEIILKVPSAGKVILHAEGKKLKVTVAKKKSGDVVTSAKADKNGKLDLTWKAGKKTDYILRLTMPSHKTGFFTVRLEGEQEETAEINRSSKKSRDHKGNETVQVDEKAMTSEPEKHAGKAEQEPAQEEPKEEPETDKPEGKEPEQPAEEPEQEPEQEEPKEEPEADEPEVKEPEQPAEEPEQEPAQEEPKEEPEADEPEVKEPEQPAEEPAQEPEQEEPEEEPEEDEPEVKEPEQPAEEPAQEPEQEEPKEEPEADKPEVKEAEQPAEEPEQEPEQEEPKEEPEADEPEVKEPEQPAE